MIEDKQEVLNRIAEAKARLGVHEIMQVSVNFRAEHLKSRYEQIITDGENELKAIETKGVEDESVGT